MQHRWPNPAAVVYPTGSPPRFVGRLVRRARGRLYPVHDHDAFVNAAGDGVTTTVASHFHRVRAGRVLPADTDGHTHDMTNLPTGAG